MQIYASRPTSISLDCLTSYFHPIPLKTDIGPIQSQSRMSSFRKVSSVVVNLKQTSEHIDTEILWNCSLIKFPSVV